jgi:hypothetical protein
MTNIPPSQHEEKPSGGAVHLTIPVSGPVLGEFISSLLGQRRTIERIFESPALVARYEGILNVVETIVQRLSQNSSVLVSFKSVYYFANGKISTIFSIDEFRNFSDMSPEESIGVDISMTYLVEFPTAATPERQDIRIESNCSPC